MGQVAGVRFVAAVFQPFVFLDGGWIGQLHLITGFHQPVDEPVPVVGRFHDDASQVMPVCSEQFQYPRQVIWNTLLKQNLIVVVDHHDKAII
jgi:hypothetical protein